MNKNAKKQQSNIQSAGVITIGLDIGYGVVKVVTDNVSLAFPSVMGHAREIKFQQDEIAKRHPGDQITDDDGAWFVGDLALAQLPPGELLRLRGRTANECMLIPDMFWFNVNGRFQEETEVCVRFL